MPGHEDSPRRAAIILGTIAATSNSHPVAASCSVAGYLAMMLFAGAIIEGITKK